MPAKADKQKQAIFRDNVLLPLIDKATKGLCQLYFLDASHFVMGGFAGRIWAKCRVWVKTGTGRKRFNVLGALNFVSKKMELVTNTMYIAEEGVAYNACKCPVFRHLRPSLLVLAIRQQRQASRFARRCALCFIAVACCLLL